MKEDTKKHNLHFLIDYYYSPHLNLSKQEILDKIDFWIENNNSYQVDFIDYEQLMFFEFFAAQEDEEISTKLQQLKCQIVDNYIIKEKLLFKMIG